MSSRILSTFVVEEMSFCSCIPLNPSLKVEKGKIFIFVKNKTKYFTLESGKDSLFYLVYCLHAGPRSGIHITPGVT